MHYSYRPPPRPAIYCRPFAGGEFDEIAAAPRIDEPNPTRAQSERENDATAVRGDRPGVNRARLMKDESEAHTLMKATP